MQAAERPAGGDGVEWRFKSSLPEVAREASSFSLAIPAQVFAKGSRERVTSDKPGLEGFYEIEDRVFIQALQYRVGPLVWRPKDILWKIEKVLLGTRGTVQ